MRKNAHSRLYLLNTGAGFVSYNSRTTTFMRNYHHYDLTMKKKKRQKYVTRNHEITKLHIQPDVLKAYMKASLGLFLSLYILSLAKIEAHVLVFLYKKNVFLWF